MVYKCNKKMKVDKCSKDAVKIKGYGNYCRMCYNKLKGNKKYDKLKGRKKCSAKKKDCNWTWLGCADCEQPICPECWPEYTANDHNI